MKNYRKNIVIGLGIISVTILIGCATQTLQPSSSQSSLVSSSSQQDQDYNGSDFFIEDWTIETHSNDVEPNFDEVFDDSQVKRIDITISPQNREIMQDNMVELYGTPGTTTQQQPRNGGGAGLPPQGEERQGVSRQERNRPGGPGRGGGMIQDLEENPVFVPATITYNDIQRSQVGVRFKGNSSLRSSWTSGNNKLPFKLDFDEFEDDYPELKNQRFYGFKQLSLKNNYLDPSFLREKVASDIFRDAGIPSAHSAFYELYVDYGQGPIYYGVYTLVEEVDDTLIQTQFEDGDGNLYKPDGEAATFKQGTFDVDQYDKQTNEDEEDYSDIKALLGVLHNESRLTNPVLWRKELDTVFDTDHFLQYLAINTVIQNRDTYGAMTHNYFLYNNPETGLLTRIPRDNNEALQEGKRNGSLPLDFTTLEPGQRPLIEYLYEDDTYRQVYEGYLLQTITQDFGVQSMQSLYTAYKQLLEPYAFAEQPSYTFLNSPNAFDQAYEALETHVIQRVQAVETYLQQ